VIPDNGVTVYQYGSSTDNRMISLSRHGAKGSHTYCAATLAFNVFVFVLLIFATSAEAGERPVVLALGDSLTAGYGLPPGKAFPEQLQSALRDSGIDAKVINGGVSGDTSAGGLARLDWLLGDKPDLVIVELGANDGLRGLDPANTRDNLDRIIARIHKTGAQVLLAGMVAPANLGGEYGEKFASLYPALAQKHGTAFYPFFLDGVAMNPALNQEDGIHPTAEGIAMIVGKMLPVVIGGLAEAAR
jgi:acyl-CoA thioesterase-1